MVWRLGRPLTRRWQGRPSGSHGAAECLRKRPSGPRIGPRCGEMGRRGDASSRLKMKYRQIDRILSLDPGKRITAEKTLRADEEYLLDHFPRFPVMPGVVMLEALHQAAVWMIRTGDGFASPLVMLREARNVKFGDFLAPGETLRVTAELVKEEGALSTVKASAEKDGRVTVSARLKLERCGTGDPDRIGTDEDVRDRAKEQYRELFGDPFVAIDSSQ